MIEKLVKKWEKHAIPGFMKYIVLLYAAGFLLGMINPVFYYEWLMLDFDKVFEGQIWRLVTFIIQPINQTNIFFEAVMLFVYYSIGTSIERLRGAARFNLFYFNGVIMNIICQALFYGIANLLLDSRDAMPLFDYPAVSLSYFNMTLFLALAVMLPNMTFLLMFFIPVKAKYFIIIYVIEFGIELFYAFSAGWFNGVCTLIMIIAAVFNMLLFYRPWGGGFPGQKKRQREFQRVFTGGMQYRPTGNPGNPGGGQQNRSNNVYPFPGSTITRHKCAVCGRTEKDGYDLEFRFCSKCNGNYEYCMDHINNHTHVE
ncbi:MAG: rhomboid family intramembrane serine protease [Lachnospiraceae bacterium]|nr:rhomboid family intramembrane serine protease [Lachnospiraceae bacterium]